MNRVQLAVVALAVLLSASALAQQRGTIFIVRHAEKQTSSANGGPAPTDPELTDVGRKRAACLAQTLKDSEITTVITSGVTRTNQTAEPIAAALHVEVKKLPSIPETVATARRAVDSGSVLIVGHSNTIPEIVKGLAGKQVSVPDEAFDLMFVIMPGPTAKVLTIHYCPAGR